MKLALVGHRGVGKSHLILRMSSYLPDDHDVIFVSLDKEVEKWVGKSIPQIFEEEGESAFREYEKRIFHQISEKETDANIVVDVGAGFEGEFSEDWKVLWVKRPIDSAKSQFLNRPNLDGKLSMDSSRFEEREKRYRSSCNFELELLEHNQLWCLYEKKYFTHLFNVPKNIQTPSSWYVTLKEGMHDLDLIHQLTGCGVELRDDLLEEKTFQRGLESNLSKIISFRNPDLKKQTESFIDDEVMWDWPLEWGVSEAPIHSLHERKDSLLETIKPLESIDSIVKLAIPIKNFTELSQAWQWQQESPEKRVFLPSSQDGRWSWFRLLKAQYMKFSYLRSGSGSSPDQPTLLEVLRYNKNYKNWAALLGSPVKHSLTPSTHDFFFKDKKANVMSVKVDKDDWDEAMPLLENFGMKWSAVTSPLKLKAHSLVKENKASSLKATNTLCLKDTWFGENTDIDGLKVLAENIKNESVVVWGGGGTLEPLKEFLPQAVFYSSRSGLPRGESVTDSPKNIIWAVGHSDFTKEGVYPPEDWAPSQVIDLNYTQDSPGISCAYNYGCQYHSGLDMFLEQAHKQQEFWMENGI